MSSVRYLLAVGNGKLGEQIAHFDLPAVLTCPGRTSACERACYARGGRFHFDSVQERFAWCYEQSLLPDFADRVRRELRRRGLLVVRLHVSGDFYSAEYAEKWLSVMRRLPKTRFYFYTRSWRVPEVALVLRQMAALRCCRPWYSVDRDSGLPAEVPPGVRLAYMQDAEVGVQNVQLVFRTRGMLDRPRVGLPMVCPNDTPQGRQGGTNCGSCGYCWR